MVITSLRDSECMDLLARSHLGHIACASGEQPYVVPIYIAVDGIFIYGFSTVGRKIEWMRRNPRVCVEVDDTRDPARWSCVVVLGTYQELPETPEWMEERQRAWLRLQEHANWWVPGYSRTVTGGGDRPMVPVFFRVRCDKVTGHRAVPDETAPRAAEAPFARFLGALRMTRHRWLTPRSRGQAPE